MKLVLKDLSKSYGDNEVLKNVNFEFESGKIYGLLGRNGSGKTTLMNIINEDTDFNSGEFYLDDGTPLKTEDIGYVISTPVVPDFLTAREFLEFFIDIHKDEIKEPKTIEEYFKIVGLESSDWDKLLKDYSHGMKNKIQILINIIANPKLILMDEPLMSLDVVMQDEMKKLFKGIKKDHIIIFSTHILELALDLCDEIVLLNNKTLTSVNKKTPKTKIIEILKGEVNE